MEKQQINNLLRLYFTNQATHKQREALFEELQNSSDESEWEGGLLQLLKETPPEENYDPAVWRQRINEILKPKAKVVSLKARSKWYRIAAAAVVIGIIAIAVVGVLTNNHNTQSPPVAKTNEIPAPKETRAVITLADGTKLYLDSAANGTIAQQQNVKLVKTKEGEVVYQTLTTDRSALSYNTAYNPRGSRVLPLTLNDGTKVWLNAESSLKYPAAFNGSERKVEVTGEAYFEVAHDAAHPFIVSKGETSVTVLGTHFNVNAYDDEQAIKVTLLEGSVNVSTVIARSDAGATKQSPKQSSVTIKPGQQAELTRNTPLVTRNNVDLDEVMAWKNGRFEFGGQALDAVMKQISRWYDVNVVYEGEKPVVNFRGSISRQENISEVLKMLELTKAVKFRTEGKKIIVTK